MTYKRLTEEMKERLTNSEYNPEYDFCCDCKYYGEPNGCNRKNGECVNYERFIEMYNHLAGYEDLEEQGLLVRLPTTLNKPVYIIMGDKSIKEMTVLEYYIEPNGIFARLSWMEGRHNMRMTVSVKELNTCYAEAEKKLKEVEFEDRVKLGQSTIINDD